MANKNISGLTAATTPLAGTELVPVWDGTGTKKVSVDNLTVGKSVAATQFTASTGNFVPATSGKGVDFSAHSSAAGVTSKVLVDYEEGTWTPNQGAGLTVIGAFSSSGTYTKIGRQVTVSGILIGATSIAAGSASYITTNLPFNSATPHGGVVVNGSLTVSAGILATSSVIYAADALAASPNIYFSVTYAI